MTRTPDNNGGPPVRYPIRLETEAARTSHSNIASRDMHYSHNRPLTVFYSLVRRLTSVFSGFQGLFSPSLSFQGLSPLFFLGSLKRTDALGVDLSVRRTLCSVYLDPKTVQPTISAAGCKGCKFELCHSIFCTCQFVLNGNFFVEPQ